MNEGQQPESNAPGKPVSPDPDAFAKALSASEGRRKRQTIKIKVPRKPSAPPTARPVVIGAHLRNPAPPPKISDFPLLMTAFVIVTLLALVYFLFFFEFIRLMPLKDFLPRILWPHVVQKLLGIALLVGFGLFETARKGLSPRARWGYFFFLALGVALFVVQCLVRW